MHTYGEYVFLLTLSFPSHLKVIAGGLAYVILRWQYYKRIAPRFEEPKEAEAET